MTHTKKYKITTSGYYFTYSHRRHPFYRDQFEKIASLYRANDDQLIGELNTEADKVHGIDKFTHKETIQWFDSILNPVETILRCQERKYKNIVQTEKEYTNDKWIKIESEVDMPNPKTYVLVILDYTEYGRGKRIEIAHVNYTEEYIPYGGPNSLTGSGMLKGIFFSIPAILHPKTVTHWMPLPELPID